MSRRFLFLLSLTLLFTGTLAAMLTRYAQPMHATLSPSVAAPLPLPAARAAMAGMITVNSNGTAIANDGVCTLPEAIIAANTDTASGAMAGECAAGMAGADTITLPAGATITLTTAHNTTTGVNGLPVVTSPITIEGNNATVTRDAAALPFRFFEIAGMGNLTLNDLTLSDGLETSGFGQGGAILVNSGRTLVVNRSTLRRNGAFNDGGAIANDGGNVTLSFSTFSDNFAIDSDGGAYSSENPASNLSVNNSLFEGNSAFSDDGGAIGNDEGHYEITNSFFVRNYALEDGGAIFDAAAGQTNTISGTTFYANRAAFAGALILAWDSTINVSNSTFYGNSADVHAGAIDVLDETGTLNLTHVTITGNSAPNTGGLYAHPGMDAGTLDIRNTIIANNTGGNCSFPMSTGTNNLEDAGPTCGPGFTVGNPMLGPLGYHGGPLAGAPGTQVGIPTLLPFGSAAINTGSNANSLTTDQRGVTRPQGGTVDIGAVERRVFESGTTITLLTNPASDPSLAALELSEAISVANASAGTPTTINLFCGVYSLVAHNNTFYGFTGLPAITSLVTIEGNGAVIERSNSARSFRLFAIAGNGAFDPVTGITPLTPGNLTLRQMTLRGGLAQGGQGGSADEGGGGGGGAGLGGAIYNQGVLTVSSSTLTANTAQGGTGGIGNVGAFLDGGGGGGGLGGNGGIGLSNGGGGGGGFGGNGGDGDNSAGGGGGGTITNGAAGSFGFGGFGGSANGGKGGDIGSVGAAGGFGGGAGGGGNEGSGGNGGLGGGGGGGGDSNDPGVIETGGVGGFGGGGGGGGEDANGNAGGFGGGGGGGGEDEGDGGTPGNGGFGGGNGGLGTAADDGGGGGGGLGAGGAIFNDGGTLILTNSTLSGNSAQGGAGGTGATVGQAGQGLGGGLFARNGNVTINNVTLNNNSVTNGAGMTVANGGGSLYLLGDAQIVRAGDPTVVTFNVTNSILANTPNSATDVFITTHPTNGGTATPGTNNNNLVRVNGASGLPAASIVSSADPQLGGLTVPSCAAGGCRTPVHPITTTSPAFNMAGGNATSVDQCGTSRPAGFADIGAYEVAAPPPLTVLLTDPIVCNGVGGIVIVTAQLTNPNGFQAASSFTAMLPAELSAITGSCTATTGTCNIVNPGQVDWNGNLNANQTVTIQYQALVANGTPPNQLLCVNSTGTVAGINTRVQACGTTNCPPNNLNNPPANVAVSGQKAGSVLVFPYYTAKAATKSDTRLTLSNIGAAETIAHLFFIDGTSCQQSDFFVCLTPNASISLKASEYDPETTGWLLAVAVGRDGRPVQNNALIGNAFVNDGLYVDNYGAESFAAKSANVAVVQNNTARLLFNDVGYEAVPDQFGIEIQSPVDAPGQRIVTVGLLGDLTTSQLSGAAQIGVGTIFNGNEKPSGSFSNLLAGNCQAITTLSTSNPRVPGGMTTMVPSSQVGTLRFNVGASVGLLLTPRGGVKGWHGIRALHKTHTTFSTIAIPLLTPVC